MSHNIEETFALNPAQRWLIHYFPEPYEWFDCLNFTIHEPISLENVKHALSQLVKRHDGLRTTFIYENEKWMQKKHAECPLNLLDPVVIEGEGLSENACEELISAQRFKICNTFNITALPLFKVLIIKRSDSSFRFCILFHHIIVDYVAMVLFFKEFYALYKNKEHSQNASNSSNSSYAKEIEAAEKLITEFDIQNYWKNQRLDLSKSINYGIKSEKPSQEKTALHLKKTFSKELSGVLWTQAKPLFGINSLHPILVAPLYKALSELTKNHHIRISHKLHGREIKPSDNRFFSAIGNFAINVPLLCELPHNEPWKDLIQRIHQTLNTDPTKGLIYDLIGPSLKKGMYPDELIAPVRFNFMGSLSFNIPENIEIQFKNFAHRVTPPNQKLTTFIEFFVYFDNKELTIHMCGDELSTEPSFCTNLFNTYLKNLTNIINVIKEGSK